MIRQLIAFHDTTGPFQAPIAYISGLPTREGLSSLDIRAIAAALNRIADDCEALAADRVSLRKTYTWSES